MKMKLTIALLACAATLSAQNVSVTRHTEVTPEGGAAYFPVLSPDGSKMAYTSSDYTGLKVLDFTTGNSQVVSFSAGAGFDPVFSIDGSAIYYRQQSTVGGQKLRSLSEWGIRHLHLPLPEDLKRALSFVAEDSAFAKKGLEAVKNGDATAFGKIMAAEQRNLSELADLTSPEVDWLVKRGFEAAGVRGITEISVGISGTLVALIENGAVEQYSAQLEEYERIFGFHPIMREYVPSRGIRMVSLDEDPSL